LFATNGNWSKLDSLKADTSKYLKINKKELKIYEKRKIPMVKHIYLSITVMIYIFSIYNNNNDDNNNELFEIDFFHVVYVHRGLSSRRN
jgi:hypothetical protein